jgi:hypothetical protein
MIRNISNLRLILFLAVIILIYVSIRVFRHTGRSKSFRTEIVRIDTARVTKLSIAKQGMQFEVFKDENGSWKVTLPKYNKTVEATASSVKSALNGLQTIQPSRITTKDPAKWADYQVDTSGTRVRVYQGKENTLDLVIGRFGVQGRQLFYTYVRLFNENTVYTAENFMGISFFSDPSNFRNSRLLQVTSDSVKRVTFTYPGDSSFVLNKPDSIWYLGNVKADSAGVEKFLSELRYVSGNGFVDDVDAASFIQPAYTILIELKGLKSLKVNAFNNPKYGLVTHSDYNPNNYFSDDALVKKLFVSRKEFVVKPKVQKKK